MPARKTDAIRTPSGRVSRAFVPVLGVPDLQAIQAAVAEATRRELEEVPDARDRMVTAGRTSREVDARLKAYREERDRLAVVLWLYHRARGSNFKAAAGVTHQVLYRAKKKFLGVREIPKIPGSERVDFHECERLARLHGLPDDPDAPSKFLVVVKEVARLEGQLSATRRVRDDLAIDAVLRGEGTWHSIGSLVSVQGGWLQAVSAKRSEDGVALPLHDRGLSRADGELDCTKYIEELAQIAQQEFVSTRTTEARAFLRSQKIKDLVLSRALGRCENPRCTGMAGDVTRAGLPILEVDHIRDLQLGGADNPGNMIALCPNCHACKTRGSQAEMWRSLFLMTVQTRHAEIKANDFRSDPA